MTLHTPWWMQPSSGDPDITYTGLELRNYTRGLLSMADGFQAERGVIGNTGSGLGFSVVQHAAGANFSVDIGSGKAVINPGDATNDGSAIVWSDATYNLATPSPPATGADLHRVVLQFRDKLENGSYTTYDFIPVLVADTSGSSTLPAEPTSAITIATVAIAAGQSSVTNSNITDYRESVANVAVVKASGTSRASTTSMTNDPDLQLNNLAAGATYEVRGTFFYNGGSGANEGDLQGLWNSSGCSMQYSRFNFGTDNNLHYQYDTDSDGTSFTARTQGTGTPQVIDVNGTIVTTTAPCYMRFKWAQNTSNSTATTMMAGSFLRARRIL